MTRAPGTPREQAGRQLLLTRLWILYSVFCSAAGWILSGLHSLNATGWILSAAAFILLLSRLPGFSLKALFSGLDRRSLGVLRRRRFSRALPLCFLVAAVIIFLRTFANPGVYVWSDVDSYRIPRVLHWIHDQQWTWIHCTDARLNNRGCVFEWMELPFLLLNRSDWLIPLLTAIPFFLFPGLTFVTLRNLKISPRVAWSWCWILPSTSCILYQAGTGSTDGVGAFYALAAVGFALEGRRRSDFSWYAYSLLAAGLMVGLKSSNLPLLLPIAVALWPGRNLLFQRPAATVAVLAITALVSFLPIAVANIIHLHDWTGLSGESDLYKPASPVVALVLNAILVLAYFVAPPIGPFGSHVSNVFDFLHSAAFDHIVATQFEPEYGLIRRRRDEDLCGVGIGIAVLLAPFIWRFLIGQSRSGVKREAGFLRWSPAQSIGAATWLALIVVLAKSTLFALPRVLAPYYPLSFLPLFCVAGAGGIVRHSWWRNLAVGQFALMLIMIMASTTSPPWPLQTASILQAHLSAKSPFHYILGLYRVQQQGVEFQRSVAAQLPADPEIGLIRRWAAPESGYWVPYGTRVMTQVRPEDTTESLLRRGIHYVVVNEDSDLQPTLRRFNVTIERAFTFTNPYMPASYRTTPVHIYLLKLNAPASRSS